MHVYEGAGAYVNVCVCVCVYLLNYIYIYTHTYVYEHLTVEKIWHSMTFIYEWCILSSSGFRSQAKNWGFSNQAVSFWVFKSMKDLSIKQRCKYSDSKVTYQENLNLQPEAASAGADRTSLFSG